MLHAAQLANMSRVRGSRISAQAGSLPNARWTPSTQQVLDYTFNDVPVVACVLAVSAVLAPMTGLFAAIPYSEYRNGLQLQQLMSSLLSFDYWLSHFLWDFLVLHVLGFCAPVTPAFLWFFGDRGVRFQPRCSRAAVQITITFISLTFGVVPTLLEILWDAEGPSAAPMGRKLTLASRAVPSSALSAGLVNLLRLNALGQLCDLPNHQRITLCRDLKRRLMTRSTATEALAICCPETNELEIEEVPSWSDLLASDMSLIYDVGTLLGCGIIALLLLSLGDAVVVPLVHSVRYLGWRKAGPSTTSKVAAVEASGLMSPVNAAVFAPPLAPSEPQHPSAASPTVAGSVPTRTPTASSSLPTSGSTISGTAGLPHSTTTVWAFTCFFAKIPVTYTFTKCDYRERAHLYEVDEVDSTEEKPSLKAPLRRTATKWRWKVDHAAHALRGELLPTAGASIVYGNDLRSQRAGYVTCVGYQPSTGGYVPELTARQHLELLAVLRLLPHQNVDALVGHVLRLVDLDLEADKRTQLYCRSSQRKLGLAMALLGGSTPAAAGRSDERHRSNHGAQIPECLALCSRVIVLSGGEQTWSGAVANLRNTFFMGMVVTVTLTVEQKEDTMRAFLRRVNEIFEGEALAVSKAKNVVRFKICDPLYSIRSLKRKLALLLCMNVVREVDFGHVALHKLFGIEEPE
ncbi:hypothetical protein MTO96_000190 [Rhipicephalus appendiculatus]